MFAIDDVDAERATDAGQFAGARIRHHHDGQRGHAAIHAPPVLQHEATLEPVKLAGNLVDGDISRGTLGAGAGRQHLATRRGLKVTAEFLGEQQSSEQGVIRDFRVRQRLQNDFEAARGSFHTGLLDQAGSLKFGFSMMPNTLPQGSSTSAMRMPSPTSWISPRGSAPSSSRRAYTAFTSLTPQ